MGTVREQGGKEYNTLKDGRRPPGRIEVSLMTVTEAVALIVALAFLAAVAVAAVRDGGMQQAAEPDPESQEEYAREMKAWGEQLEQQEELRREALMNEFAQYVWAVSSVGETADEERAGTKVLSVAPDTDILRITTSYGLVVKASFLWGGRHTRILAEAEFFGVRSDGGGGYVIHQRRRFRGGRVSLPLGKVARWASSVAGAAVAAIASLGQAMSVGGADDGTGGGDGASPAAGQADGEHDSMEGGKGK